MRLALSVLLLVVCFTWSVAEKKCEDKKKDECKNIDANKCRTKGNACLKSCRMCVEGQKEFDSSPSCWADIQRSGCSGRTQLCRSTCKGFLSNPYGYQQMNQQMQPNMGQQTPYRGQWPNQMTGQWPNQMTGQQPNNLQYPQAGQQQYGVAQTGAWPQTQYGGNFANTGYNSAASTYNPAGAATAAPKPAGGLFRKHSLEKTKKEHHKKSKHHHKHHKDE